METINKIPLELFVDIRSKSSQKDVRLVKVVYVGFVPQHGMEILDTEVVFKVRTTALAGLQNLKHVAYPLRRGRMIEGNRKIISKMFPKDDALLEDSVSYFIKQGWDIER
jgi:hypothetical protein